MSRCRWTWPQTRTTKPVMDISNECLDPTVRWATTLSSSRLYHNEAKDSRVDSRKYQGPSPDIRTNCCRRSWHERGGHFVPAAGFRRSLSSATIGTTDRGRRRSSITRPYPQHPILVSISRQKILTVYIYLRISSRRHAWWPASWYSTKSRVGNFKSPSWNKEDEKSQVELVIPLLIRLFCCVFHVESH